MTIRLGRYNGHEPSRINSLCLSLRRYRQSEKHYRYQTLFHVFISEYIALQTNKGGCVPKSDDSDTA